MNEENVQQNIGSEQTMGSNQSQKDQTSHTSQNQEPLKEIHHHHYYKNQKSFHLGKFFLGLILLIIGLIYLVSNVGVIPFNIDLNWNLIFPVLIIFLGLSMMSGRGLIAKIFGIIFVIFIAFFVVAAFVMPQNLKVFGNFSKTQEIKKIEIKIAKENVSKTDLTVINGASQLTINSGVIDQNIQGELITNFFELEKNSKVENDKQVVTLASKGNYFGMGKLVNEMNLDLNQDMLYTLNIESGASKNVVDLTNVKFDQVNISAGASDTQLNIGNKQDSGKIKIDAGASKVKLNLPKDLGVKINIDSGLTNKNFADFAAINEKNYQSNNYDKTTKKLDIEADLGAADFEISWYEPVAQTIEKDNGTNSNSSTKKIVTYDEAVNSLKSCQVASINQKQNLEFEFILKDNSVIVASENKIDDIIVEARKYQSTCGLVKIITQ